MMMLSFVIPVYNCAGYIKKNLDVVYSAGVDERSFEIVLVDDGSTDESLQIIREYRKQKENIIVLSQDNRGASSARNAGLDCCAGDYVWFVDADDRIEALFFSKVMALLECRQYDVICFNHHKEFKEGLIDCVEYKARVEVDGTYYYEHRPSGFIWNKIYKRSFLDNNRFVEGTKNIEDLYFNTKTTLFANRILLLPEFGYIYNNTNQNSTSSNRSKRNLVKLHQDTMMIHKSINDDIEGIRDALKKKALMNLLMYSEAGCLFSLLRYYNRRWTFRAIDKYKFLSLYPMKYIGNVKANTFIFVVNHTIFIELFYKFVRLKKIIRKK